MYLITGLPRWLSGNESTCQCRRYGLDPWVRKIPCRRAQQPTPVFLPGESHGQRSLVGYSPWGDRESDTIETTYHTCTCVHLKEGVMQCYLDGVQHGCCHFCWAQGCHMGSGWWKERVLTRKWPEGSAAQGSSLQRS